jgi:uncharacterized protein YbjT (DUF2867 family)
MSRVLVIGASGTVGGQLVRELEEKGHDVLRATSGKRVADNQVHLDLVTGQGVESALARADKAFLLAPPGYTNQDELLGPVIAEAAKRRLQRVVLMTAMGANADPASPLRKAELQLQASGVQWNVIRPNWFMQNFNTYWLPAINAVNRIQLPTGKAKGSFLDARDISAVAAELLTADDHANTDFDLTGPRALDHDEVAAILAKEAGREIRYEDITPQPMLESLLNAKLPRPYAEFLVLILGYFREGYAERTTEAVSLITGKAPRAFEAYARDYRNSWITQPTHSA